MLTENLNETINTTIIASTHSKKRIKERCGMGKHQAADRLCQLAKERGINYKATKGKVYAWALERLGPGTDIYSIYFFGDKAFLFARNMELLVDVLVTVMQLPSDVHRLLCKNKSSWDA